MLLTRLYPYDPTTDSVEASIQLRLRDSDLSAILDHLKKAEGEGITVRVEAKNNAGDGQVEVRMDWRPESAAFACSVEGLSAGYLMHDEIAGAVGKPAPENHRTCRVCLSAELDLWRSGVVDVDRGYVHVYTEQAGLASLGAYAYLTDVDDSPTLDGLYIELGAGEPTRGALRVPSTPLRAMQGLLEPAVGQRTLDPQDNIERLNELVNAVAQLQENMRNGPKLG